MGMQSFHFNFIKFNKNNNKIDNELEAFSYPFKDDSMCYIF